jgi:hypothetical protein
MVASTTSIHRLVPKTIGPRSSKLRLVLKRISLPLNSHAAAATALSPAVDARILGSAAKGAFSAGSDHSGASIL